jgi:hypothetical protein
MPACPEPAEATPPRRRWLRYSLRTLLVLIAALGIWLGIAFHRAREQARAVAALKSHAGVYYDYQVLNLNSIEDALQSIDESATSDVPEWLLDGLGVDFFHDVTLVYLFGDPPADDNTLAALTPLRKLRFLSIRSEDVTNAGLAHVRSLVHLQSLELFSHAHWFGFLNDLRFDDDGLSEIAALSNLQELRIGPCDINDTGLEHLTSLRKLRLLEFHETEARLTRAGVEQLSRALPDCKITVYHRGRPEIEFGPDTLPDP